ncbi:MAG TPA: DUF4214 domain-containing protein [Pyrinomonadaceae bacterium]|nr:DUF4214 domain-containing protein [Pyrinomonadaceae bacterium]
MRYSITLLAAAVLIFFVSQRIEAQQPHVIMSSSLTRDVTTGEMVGFSRTEMDFNTAGWYRAYVYNEIRRQSDNALLASGETYSIPGSNSVAARTSRTPGVPNVTYRLDSRHFILPLSNGWCTGSPQDVYSYATIFGIGGNYGATQTHFGFFCSGQFCGVCVSGWIYLGQTTQSKTVPGVTITNPRIGSVPAQSTQTALLGADVVLSSNVTPTGGNYSWTFTGPYSISGGSQSGSSVTIRSSDVGTITARLTYTQNGIPESQQFTINVVTPTLQSFTAHQASDLIAAPFQCDPNVPFWYYKLGCTAANPGIRFTATVQVNQFISDPTQSGIKMVQAVSSYRKEMIAGNLKCSTRRSDPSNVASGWQLDFADPYPHAEVHRFSEGNTLTTHAEDTPSQNLALVTSLEFVDAVQVDDRFEMYVVYFTFDPANSPITRTLGKLEWTFGGLVVFDDPHTIRTSLVVPGPKTGQAATSMVSMQGKVQDNPWEQCPGIPLTTNKIDATRIYVAWLYRDLLDREPDNHGWNDWTANITQCIFDFGCIMTKRASTPLGFFFSQEFKDRMAPMDPVMATHGTPNFNPAQYNPRFVYWCYKLFLKREPDEGGFANHLNKLNATGDYSLTVFDFIYSNEYRSRNFF